jgi:phosphotriesterase-related protein
MSNVMTVRGPITPEELGFCQPHEHVMIDLWTQAAGRWDIDGLLDDEEMQRDELQHFRAAGGRSIVDPTLPAIGRDPEALRRLSDATDVHIVMGCGWYRQPYYPASIDQTSVRDLAQILVDEARGGVGNTGVRPGIIGEIGSDKSYVSAQEERVFRAAARAHLETGLAVTTHSVGTKVGLDHLRILLDEGVPPSRIAIGHCDASPQLGYLEAIAGAGAYVELDNIGYDDVLESLVVSLIVSLVRSGYGKQVLLSQDICKRSALKVYGGPGYDYLLTRFHATMLEAGITDDEWRMMTVENPARLIAA